ncbi:MAG: 2-hydroxyglutaryl-CoA dehydratase [Tissierellia bacterium]|nr:2-hydroxyglutaryl-CoA dehydratase [Tissierellia bacterium]
MILNIGLDIGSTTIKLIVLDDDYNIIYKNYERHYSDIGLTLKSILEKAKPFITSESVRVSITGSGGLQVKDFLQVEFIQEVVAAVESVKKFIPKTDVAIELGGEDSKITFFRGALEQRMNSICAGGTGAFIDQMASLLETDAAGLNELAKKASRTYPIASRCGVFAKTDIQALMNQGVPKEDIAVSVFQSVVNQTISNLACGRTIEGNVAFLGGPLHYLDVLVERFIKTLELEDDEIIIPEDSNLYVALGAAIAAMKTKPIKTYEFFQRAEGEYKERIEGVELDPLFKSPEEYEEFKEKHAIDIVKYGDLKGYKGKLAFGVDAGSTTTKLVVLGEDNEILYSFYGNNYGKPLEVVMRELGKIYDMMDEGAEIVASGATGYGEDFLRAALNIDVGEVETIAHFRAARFFNEDVDFILDIGGQDMKAMRVKDGMISSILLNEACSAGCGSFLETFANSLNLSVQDFAKLAVQSKKPVDLGSRCTVFMNSKVKQAQKEGAAVSDIAAGLSYSVIKNALQKVIKIRNFDEMGENIVVQGGTFLSDGILRAFEKISGRTATRPKIAGLMGAFGIALIAKEKSTGKSSLKNKEELEKFEYTTKTSTCKGCTNHCSLTINVFNDGGRYITGNRCERPLGNKTSDELLPNLFTYKAERVFQYESLPPEDGKGVVGIPRVLNMYENYPFWHTLLTELGFSVVLSTKSSREVYELGISSITSETLCYPAKLVHGHIEDLIKKEVDIIFYPSVFYEEKEFENADNSVNCPVVAGYPDVIKNNVDNLKNKNVRFVNPFVAFQDRTLMKSQLVNAFKGFGFLFAESEMGNAVDLAYRELDRYRDDVVKEGDYALEYMKEHGLKGIVLAGRPYHVDPEINHGIPEMINSLGFVVLSEDSVATKTNLSGRMRILDQWSYHARLYRAAKFVGKHEDLNLIQLNSFGCGIDAVTTDQVAEILKSYNKIYTALKIDEVNNLGAARIRVRSLKEAIENRKDHPELMRIGEGDFYPEYPVFTVDKRKTHTILAPQMAPIHFEILEEALQLEGYNLKFLKDINKETIELGIKYVNNDACYPTMFVVGQFLQALQSGEYDPDYTTVLMTQTGGACRASNYVGLIRKALIDAGFPQVPVIALSVQGIEGNPGFKLTPSLGKKAVIGGLYGDLLMRLRNENFPYEKHEGSTEALVDKWVQKLKVDIAKGDMRTFKRNVDNIILSFKNLEKTGEKKPKAGIVGEILVKFLPQANNFVQKIMEEEGFEVIVPDLVDFILYCFSNSRNKNNAFGGFGFGALISDIGIMYVERYRNYIRRQLKKTGFSAPLKIGELEELGKEFVSLNHQYGEGWLLTAEMVELIHSDAPNIVCVQPFGCLPNHLTGKGAIKAIREKYPRANIVPIDYDPGASEVNQLNRIKLMLSHARDEFYKNV